MSALILLSVFSGDFTEAAMAFFSQYGYLALLLFVFAETSMLFPFLPSELVVPAAAALLVTGPLSALAFVGVNVVGTVAGSLLAYYAFGGGSSRLFDRLSSRMSVSERQVERSKRWFRRWGESSVFWGRLLPGLRSIISIPAGFAEMSVGKFALYSGAGGGLFAAGVAALVLAGADGRLSHAFVVFARPHFFAALALARSRPVLAVATVLLALFAALLARNAYVIRSNSW